MIKVSGHFWDWFGKNHLWLLLISILFTLIIGIFSDFFWSPDTVVGNFFLREGIKYKDIVSYIGVILGTIFLIWRGAIGQSQLISAEKLRILSVYKEASEMIMKSHRKEKEKYRREYFNSGISIIKGILRDEKIEELEMSDFQFSVSIVRFFKEYIYYNNEEIQKKLPWEHYKGDLQGYFEIGTSVLNVIKKALLLKDSKHRALYYCCVSFSLLYSKIYKESIKEELEKRQDDESISRFESLVNKMENDIIDLQVGMDKSLLKVFKSFPDYSQN